MKGVTGLTIAAVLLALVGAVCVSASRLERDLARADEDVVAGRYDQPQTTFDSAERYLEYGSHVPWIGTEPLDGLRARRAAVQYWQHQYDGVVPQQSDPVGAVSPENVDLQLVVANAVYRTGQAQATDRQSMLRALDAGIAAYAAVLKNADRQEDAAYNYEYLVRLRDEVDKGKRKPGGEAVMKGPEGATGAPPTIDSSMSDFKIYIPLESQERQDNGTAGKAGALKRKG